MTITEQMINECYDVILDVQCVNPPGDFGSYHNYFSTTLSWGIEKYIDIKELGYISDIHDQILERVIDQCY
jgi:hypothetical protein